MLGWLAAVAAPAAESVSLRSNPADGGRLFVEQTGEERIDWASMTEQERRRIRAKLATATAARAKLAELRRSGRIAVQLPSSGQAAADDIPAGDEDTPAGDEPAVEVEHVDPTRVQPAWKQINSTPVERGPWQVDHYGSLANRSHYLYNCARIEVDGSSSSARKLFHDPQQGDVLLRMTFAEVAILRRIRVDAEAGWTMVYDLIASQDEADHEIRVVYQYDSNYGFDTIQLLGDQVSSHQNAVDRKPGQIAARFVNDQVRFTVGIANRSCELPMRIGPQGSQLKVGYRLTVGPESPGALLQIVYHPQGDVVDELLARHVGQRGLEAFGLTAVQRGLLRSHPLTLPRHEDEESQGEGDLLRDGLRLLGWQSEEPPQSDQVVFDARNALIGELQVGDLQLERSGAAVRLAADRIVALAPTADGTLRVLDDSGQIWEGQLQSAAIDADEASDAPPTTWQLRGPVIGTQRIDLAALPVGTLITRAVEADHATPLPAGELTTRFGERFLFESLSVPGFTLLTPWGRLQLPVDAVAGLRRVVEPYPHLRCDLIDGTRLPGLLDPTSPPVALRLRGHRLELPVAQIARLHHRRSGAPWWIDPADPPTDEPALGEAQSAMTLDAPLGAVVERLAEAWGLVLRLGPSAAYYQMVTIPGRLAAGSTREQLRQLVERTGLDLALDATGFVLHDPTVVARPPEPGRDQLLIAGKLGWRMQARVGRPLPAEVADRLDGSWQPIDSGVLERDGDDRWWLLDEHGKRAIRWQTQQLAVTHRWGTLQVPIMELRRVELQQPSAAKEDAP